MRTKTRAPKGAPTSLNLSVLCDVFRDGDVVPNRLEATAVPHVRRCLKAGLIEVSSRTTLALTDAGREALRARGCK